MKHILLLIFMVSFYTNAQDSVKVKTPRISVQQTFNVPIETNDISVTLVEVLNDSRCPKGVNCFRAGEVKLIVEIVESGKAAKRKEIIIQAANSQDRYPLIFENESTKIYAVNLLPYPVYNVKTKTEDYVFKVEIR